MGYWAFMAASDCLVSLVMIGCGWLMWKHCPKKINNFVGYRTKMAKKNMDTWKFAHLYCGRLWWITGWLMLPSVLIMIPFMHASTETVGLVGGVLCTAQCVVLLLTIIPTELALRRYFHPDGTRKETE